MNPAWQRIAVLGICASAAVFLAGSLWQVLAALGPVLGLFFGGWLLSCLLEPLVRRIMRYTRAARSTAVISACAVVLLGAASVWFVLGPSIARQVTASATSLPSQVETAAQRALEAQTELNIWLAEHGAPVHLDVASGSGLDGMAAQLGASNPMAVVGGAATTLGNVGLMLLLSLFFLLGGPQLADQIIDWFGTRAAPDVRYVLTAVHDAFESFVRTQLLQGVMYAAGVWASLAVAQIDTAPLVGIIAGALLLVPVLGAVLAIVIPLVATILWNPGATLAVLAALVLLQQLVLNVVGPRLMSRQLGLPPLLVLFGALAGGQVGGLWGAVFGIPVLAAAITCVDHFRLRWSE